METPSKSRNLKSKRKRVSSPINVVSNSSSSPPLLSKINAYCFKNDPKLKQKCVVRLQHSSIVEDAQVKLFNALLEEQRRLQLERRIQRERSKSIDDRNFILHDKRHKLISPKQTSTVESKEETENLLKFPPKPVAVLPRKALPLTKPVKICIKRSKYDGRSSVPLNIAYAENNLHVSDAVAHKLGIDESILTEGLFTVQFNESNQKQDSNTVSITKATPQATPNDTSPINKIDIKYSGNVENVHINSTPLIAIVPKLAGRKTLENIKSNKTELQTNANNKSLQMVNEIIGKLDNPTNISITTENNVIQADEPVAINTVSVLTVCSSVLQTNTENENVSEGDQGDFITESGGAVNSLTLLANTAATTAPIPSNDNFTKKSVFVTPPVIEIAVEPPTQQIPIKQLSVAVGLSNEQAATAIVTGKSCECVTQPQRLIEWSELVNTAEIKESNLPYLNLDATPTVPAYLFNGESRDVPTPTLVAINEHPAEIEQFEHVNTSVDSSTIFAATAISTSDHEVSSTQETVCEMPKRNAQPKLTLDPSFANGQCQDNQVDTTIYLPESSLIGKRMRKLSTPDISTIHQRPGKKRRKTFCSESSLRSSITENTHASSGTSPSTTTATTTNKIQKLIGRKRTRSLKNTVADVNANKYVLPAVNEIVPALNLIPIKHTYTKINVAQKVFVPPEIEECLNMESDGLTPESKSTNDVSKNNLNSHISDRLHYNQINREKSDMKIKLSRRNKKSDPPANKSEKIAVHIHKKKK